jgi:two-component system NtrC family sensor kinase
MSESTKKPYIKLQFKITLLFFALMSMVSFTASSMLASNIENKARTVASDYITSIPYFINSSIESYMMLEDKGAIADAILNIQQDSNILGVHILNPKGEVSSILRELDKYYDPAYLDTVIEHYTPKEGFHEVTFGKQRYLAFNKPLINEKRCQACHDPANGNLIGTLNINIDLSRLKRLLNDEVIELRAFLYGTDVFLFIVLFVLIYILVIRPVRILEKGMQAVAANNLDIRTQINSNDEFGRMSTMFNYMVYSLRKAFNTISSMHKNMLHNDRLMTMGTLTASISHEIKNPLNSIMLNADIMAMKHPEVKAYTDKILRDAERIRDIIDQTLKFSRVGNDKLESINVADFIDRITIYVERTLLKWADVPFETYITEELGCIKSTPVHLEQIFINLIRNAVEAVENKENGKVMLIASKDEDFVEFEFIDNGDGITAESKQHIFTEYYTTKHNGTGLGLSIVKQLIENYGGSISFESEEGKGASFKIRFPLVADNCCQQEKGEADEDTY